MGNKYVYNNMNGFFVKYNATNKKENADNIARYLLNRTRRMFKYKNLPDTVPERNLELMLQTNGNVFWAKDNGEIYVFVGGPGGVPNEYYMPTQYVVANPYLKLSKTYDIGKDGVIMPSDSTYSGLMPLISKYSTLMAENELTMNIIDILARSSLVISAEDESERNSAQKYINDLADGKLSVITKEALVKDSVNIQPGATVSAQAITTLIELQQYYKANFYNELGLNANWNAKRETITSSEALLNTDTLWPLIDDMLKCRKEALELVNEMFGTNIEVEFDSSWAHNEKEIELTEEQLESQISDNENKDNENEEINVEENTIETEDEIKKEVKGNE